MSCSRSSWTMSSRRAGRRSVSSSTARALLSASSARTWLLTARTAMGTATSAVMMTATTAVAAVTSAKRAVRVRKNLVIGGVADATDRADQPGGPPELGAHLRDVHIDGTGARVRRVPPDRGQQLPPGEPPSRPAEQVPEQVELGRCQGQRSTLHGDPAPA